MLTFTDILYGSIELPDWMMPFLKIPEFVRLRGVRLSNVDSFQFKDFAGPTRWEHGLAVAYLALRCAERRSLSTQETVQLALSGLLHDTATPPFAHTAEYVLDNFDHEIESQRILLASSSADSKPGTPIFASQLPQFEHECRKASRKLGVKIDVEEIAKMIIGDGELGFLICGSLDLDNADNVTRASLYLGIDVNRQDPLALADWLARQDRLPLDLECIEELPVQRWLGYRRELYMRFYASNDEELGRQAFLQHLMRRGLKTGMSRTFLIRQTDESLLAALSGLSSESNGHPHTIQELVQSYRLLEAPLRVAQIFLQTEEELRILRSPQATNWIEQKLANPAIELMAMVAARRHGDYTHQRLLFEPPPGSLLIFKLGQGLKWKHLPEWLQESVPREARGQDLQKGLSQALRKHVSLWIQTRPWLEASPERVESVLQNLIDVEDWGFKLSKNDTLHPYPSTFVHAIPANLVNALGLRGELVLDPFGGTGQTATEVIKHGGVAISSDANTVAGLVCRAKLTYLSPAERSRLRAVDLSLDWNKNWKFEPPNIDNAERWFHFKTLEELCHLKGFIDGYEDRNAQSLLLACFSAILPSCTGRHDEQHGYFADNSPLSKGEKAPPYKNASQLFIMRLQKNLTAVERLYAFLERDGRDPETELERARVLTLDARKAGPKEYGINPGEVAGVITSPPYLCMSDYTLGLRLSYPWLGASLGEDFGREFGARRLRFSPEKAEKAYFQGFEEFGTNMAKVLRPGGFLAMVIGEPVAKAFSGSQVLKRIDGILEPLGFEMLWQNWRTIHWHRNHGYQRLGRERVSVHFLRP